MIRRGQVPVLCDTDVCSYLLRESPEVLGFSPYLSGRAMAISFMTVGQMYFGAFRDRWGQRRTTSLERHLANFAILPYAGLLLLNGIAFALTDTMPAFPTPNLTCGSPPAPSCTAAPWRPTTVATSWASLACRCCLASFRTNVMLSPRSIFHNEARSCSRPPAIGLCPPASPARPRS